METCTVVTNYLLAATGTKVSMTKLWEGARFIKSRYSHRLQSAIRPSFFENLCQRCTRLLVLRQHFGPYLFIVQLFLCIDWRLDAINFLISVVLHNRWLNVSCDHNEPGHFTCVYIHKQIHMHGLDKRSVNSNSTDGTVTSTYEILGKNDKNEVDESSTLTLRETRSICVLRLSS